MGFRGCTNQRSSATETAGHLPTFKPPDISKWQISVFEGVRASFGARVPYLEVHTPIFLDIIAQLCPVALSGPDCVWQGNWHRGT